MLYQTKYGIGTRVTILEDPNGGTLPVQVEQKLGFIYEVKALDPTMTYYSPIGPQQLPFAAKEQSAS
jgi:hypothetical protein